MTKKASFDRLSGLIYLRSSDYLVCLRNASGNPEKLLKAGPWTTLSADGEELAYWLPDVHELHVFSVSARKDTLVKKVPGANMVTLLWLHPERRLLYRLRDVPNAVTTIVDLESGKISEVPATVAVVGVGSGTNVLTASQHGLEEIDLASGTRQRVAAIDSPETASYSNSGQWLGILAPNLDAFDPGPASDDDLDCRGGASSLYIQEKGSHELRKVPFPAGFESVLDYDFSPDDRSLVVSFGARACDYPGDVARVYLVSLPSMQLKSLSPADRLSAKAHWSPNSRFVLYSDYSGSNTPLLAVDVTSGTTAPLTSGGDGPDEVLGWFSSGP